MDKVESAAVLGAGATASSALAALSRDLYRSCHRVRTQCRPVRREMRGWGERLGVEVRTLDWSQAVRAFDAELVIATTPAGATDELAGAVPGTAGVLFDVLYEPWPTALSSAWPGRGTVLGGMDLLVHQAVLQVELMTGCVPAPLREMRAAGERALEGLRD